MAFHDKPIPRIQAPYNFVPLSKHVVHAEGEGVDCQDHPVAQEVFSGTLRVTLHTETPLFIGADRTRGEVNPYLHPDGRHAVPGASLRGMVRNVVEIATFGCLRERVNDHRYGVRDLHNRALYGKHLTDLASVGPGGKTVPYPHSCAGLLRPLRPGEPEGFAAAIDVRSFAKVHYNELIDWAARQGVGPYPLGERCSAPQKYRSWANKGLSLDLPFEFTEYVKHLGSVKGKTRLGAYGVATLDPRGRHTGRLVMTGQPSRWDPGAPKGKAAGNAKQHDFLFFGDHGTVYVREEVLAGFRFIHSDSGQQNRLTEAPNEELRYLLQTFGGGAHSLSKFLAHQAEGIPVFFLPGDRGTVKALGLAMMFRLPHAYSVGQVVGRHQGLGEEGLPTQDDLADRLFGYVPLTHKGARQTARVTRKGRVWFSDARPEGAVASMKKVTAILSSPKASYHPSYVQQGQDPESRPANKDAYKTWSDPKAIPRGWKRYPPRNTPIERPYVSPKVKDLQRVATTFTPWHAPRGLSFTLRVHNLAAHELGALVWALDFGGHPEARHTLGMGKALGYGQVRLQVRGGRLRRSARWARALEGAELEQTVGEARQAFEDYMELRLEALGERGGWAASRSIYELVQNALPQDPGSRHLRIDDPTHGNEFISGKKQGLVLPPTGSSAGWNQQVKAYNDRLAAEHRAAEEERLRVLEALLSDEGLSSVERVRRWAEACPQEAVARLRRWCGFPGNYSALGPDLLQRRDPAESELLAGAAAYLKEHQGLARMGKVAEPVQSKLQDHLATPAATTVKAAALKPLGSLPDWSKLNAKRLKKERAKWAKKLGSAPLDDASTVKAYQHLEAHGAPRGQLDALLRAQAGHRGEGVEGLRARLLGGAHE